MYKYDVFLSFRGEDTRTNFTDHLYAALTRQRIIVFRDDEELQRGKPISPELLKAIEESKISAIVFSRNYASSTWCLDELAKIVECMNTREQNVIPIFYDVDPSMVRKQTGVFGEVFAKHEETFKEKKERVQTWKNALTKVANLSGFHLKDRHESTFIQNIVKEISKNLNPTTFMNIKDLVGIKSLLGELQGLICVGSNDVRMIGICGMGGIGKTTIARVVYDLISYKFEGSCFLANVREISKKKGLVSLQKQLLSQILMGTDVNIWDVDGGIKEIRKRLQHKNVLLVIDDVDHKKQLNNLAGKHDWFGLGSRIIITTRDKHLLVTHKVDDVYDVKELSDGEAFKLFTFKAFNHEPPEDFVELIKLVINYTGCLPLALEVLGSFFFGRTKDEWESALQRLKRDPEDGILDKLQLSFDGLKETEKRIFLDVACFFKGKDRNYVTRVLDGCGFYPTIGISVLVDKSLITISDDNVLWMHDLLQDMGQQIVKRESLNEPGKRSRLWEEADVHHVLTRNMGSEVIEGIMVNSLKEEVHCRPEAFSKMINLRLLKISNVRLPKGLDYLSNELRLLDWAGYPLKSLPSNLKLDKVVELKLEDSNIKQLWNGTKVFNRLTTIVFENCQYLERTPDFTGAPNLKEVMLRECKRLHEIHPSLLLHNNINFLGLVECTSLMTLPSKIYMQSLEELQLTSCSKLRYFPELTGRMKRLSYIDLCETAIKELPKSIGLLTGLVELYLSGCSRLESLPDTLGQVESLRMLDVSGTAIRQAMSFIFLLKKLRYLNFRGCKGPTPNSLASLFSMMSLMPKITSDTMAFSLPSLSASCTSLTELNLSNCNLDEEAFPTDFLGSFSSLKELDLSNNNFVSLPRSIDRLSKLEYLNVNGCTALETLSNAVKLCSLKLRSIYCANCLKLTGCDNMAFSTLKVYMNKVHAMLKLRDKFGFFKQAPRPKNIYSVHTFKMVVPRSEIPEWFSHQSDGDIIRIKWPPYLYNNSKFLGYLLCSRIPSHSLLTTFDVSFYMENNGRKLLSVASLRDFDISEVSLLSDHLALVFLSREVLEFYIDGGKYIDKEYDSILMALWSEKMAYIWYAVHPLFEEDVNAFSKITGQSTCWNLKQFHEEDGVGSSKRSLADYYENYNDWYWGEKRN